MNVVLCTGVMRSASTWSYNVCRVIVGMVAEKLGMPFYSQYMEEEELEKFLLSDASLNNGAMVVKAHRVGLNAIMLTRKGIVKNVCTIRDPRDCVASRRLFKDETFETSVNLVKSSFYSPMRLQDETLYVDYKDIIDDPVLEIRWIMEHLNIQSPDNSIVAAHIHDALTMDKVKEINPEGEVDSATEFHKNHTHGGIIGRWQEELNPREVEYIMMNLKEEIEWYEDMS